MTPNARSQEQVITETKKENYDGVCPNCMNGALAGCHCHPQNWNPNPNDDPLARQAMRNQRFQNAISKKIQERYNLSQKAAHHFGNESMKDKLINAQIKNEFKLNIPSKDVLRQRAMQRYNKNEEILNRGVVKFENLEVEEFYANESGNCVTDGSVCAIGNKKYYNKYLPTLDTYKKFLDDQINARQSKKLNERENDKKLEREIYEKNQRDQERERENRKNYVERLKSDFLQNNKMLIDTKSKNEQRNKSQDIAREQTHLKRINDELQQCRNEESEKKLRIRKELMQQLENQIRAKKNRKDEVCGKVNINDKNIYAEPMKFDEFGKCFGCHRQFKKKLLSSIKEYNKLRESQEK